MFKRAAASLALLAVIACNDSLTPRDEALTRRGTTANTSGLVTFFSQQFVRTTGAPNEYSVTVPTAGFQSPFEIHIRNGSASGTNRISSGWVTLDGQQLLGPSDFSQQAAEWTFTPALGATAQLDVKLASKPGSYIEITISGTPAATLFCPAGGPGAYLDLSDAVAATSPGGTILVCDGFWELDQETIDRPLTLRSQNAGGATLSDPNAGPLGQGGIPAIWVNGYTSGTVRFVDLTFSVRGRVIVPTGTYDRVEIDSSTFLGTDPTAFMVMAFNSTVPTALLEVKNSHFDGGNVGIFPVHGIEANVHHNLFENLNNSGVIHSGAGGGPLPHAHGRVEDNVFRKCGPTHCFRSFASSIVIARNRFEMPTGASRIWAMNIVRMTVGVAPVLTQFVIEDNEVIGGVLPGLPSVMTSWTIQRAIDVGINGPPAPIIVRRNTVTNAFAHLMVNSAVLPVTAHDNTFTNGHLTIGLPGNLLQFNRNDATGFGQSFVSPVNAGANYQCNWWGSAAGPVAVPLSVPAIRYTPFSTVPIANQPSVVCP